MGCVIDKKMLLEIEDWKLKILCALRKLKIED